MMVRAMLRRFLALSPVLQGALLALVSTLTAFAVPLYYIRWTTFYDWDYFNGLSLVSKSLALVFQSTSFYDAWRCGGLDILSNPQSRIASPLFILDLLLPPHLANIAGLMLYGLIGYLGMYQVGRAFGIERVFSLLIAWMFVHASWFGLHFAEGHIAFGAFQLMPWVIWLTFHLGSPKHLVALFALMTLFIIDGEFYPFIFSIHGCFLA